ncbi:11218_t:CDS:1 [Dentiscutata heterogama]|uniref:11218_t:CDS:1 n=1 Tax=Dentiscutata heterogama TaxID=1316150 RepID=A0ACA9LZU7_9GLOM|nr:11218_t:CDS:1 [Dentiscutata heterogama]
MEHDIFEVTVKEKVFGDFSFDHFPFFEKNKYDIVDIRDLTCKHLAEELDENEPDTDELDRIINKMSKIFEVHIINTFGTNINRSKEEDMSENHIISYLSSDIDKLAKLYAAFSTEIINCVDYGMIDLRRYKLAGINTSVLNAGIFSRAGNQIRLSHIINHMGSFLNNTDFIVEYNKRIHNNKVADTFNIMITSIASYSIPFGSYPPTFVNAQLDKNMSFAQLLYRNIGGNDMIKQGHFYRFDPAILPSLTEIHRHTTIKFIPLDSPELVFKFEKDKIMITKLYIHPHWIETLWNIVMLEMRSRCEPIVSTIICFYTGVLKNEKDFHLAYQLGMVYSGPITFTRFHEIICKISEVSHYNSTLEGTRHVKNLVSTVKALKENSLLQLYIISGENVLIRFFNISAIIILLLTMVQTVISILSYILSIEQMNQHK